MESSSSSSSDNSLGSPIVHVPLVFEANAVVEFDSPNRGGDVFPEWENECARQNDKAKTNPEYITIKLDFLDHLLNCLANQKYLPKEENMGVDELESQKAIDKAWNEGMELLNSKPMNMRNIKT